MSKKTTDKKESQKANDVQQKILTDTRKPWASILGILLVACLLIGGIWAATSTFLSNDDDSENGSNSNDVEDIEIGVETPGGTVDEVKQNVVTKANELLQEAVDLGNSFENYQESLVAISNGDLSLIPQSFIDRMRLTDMFETEEDIKASVYVGVIHLAQQIQLARMSGGLSEELLPLNDVAYLQIYLDLEAGNAFVPMSLYVGPEGSFSLEFVYHDGEWKFSPYSLIDGVHIADQFSQPGRSAPIPEDSPENE